MAKRKPSSSRSSSPRGMADDAFTARVLEFLAWARHKTQVLVVTGVVAVLLVVGTIYWFQQRSQQLNVAATELEQIHGSLGFADMDEVQNQLRNFLERFGGTPYGIEARLLLGEIHLEQGQPERAIEVLEPIAPGFGSPLTVQATFLLAVAYEEDARWADAEAVYRTLQERAEFTFQQREAAEGQARAQLVLGDTAGAIQTYEALLSVLDEDHPRRGRYEMRLSELTATGF